MNKGPIYLGRDPYHAGTPCYIDNLKFYDGRLQGIDEDELFVLISN